MVQFVSQQSHHKEFLIRIFTTKLSWWFWTTTCWLGSSAAYALLTISIYLIGNFWWSITNSICDCLSIWMLRVTSHVMCNRQMLCWNYLAAAILMLLVVFSVSLRDNTLIIDLGSWIIDACNIICVLCLRTLLIHSWYAWHRWISCILLMLFLIWLFYSKLCCRARVYECRGILSVLRFLIEARSINRMIRNCTCILCFILNLNLKVLLLSCRWLVIFKNAFLFFS